MFSPGKCQRLQNKPDISLQKPRWVLVSGALLDKSHFTVSERRDAHFALGTVQGADSALGALAGCPGKRTVKWGSH